MLDCVMTVCFRSLDTVSDRLASALRKLEKFAAVVSSQSACCHVPRLIRLTLS